METQKIEARICSKCNNLMIEGYCIEDGNDYYCSDKCLEYAMTKEEYGELYANGTGTTYWTEWI